MGGRVAVFARRYLADKLEIDFESRKKYYGVRIVEQDFFRLGAGAERTEARLSPPQASPGRGATRQELSDLLGGRLGR